MNAMHRLLREFMRWRIPDYLACAILAGVGAGVGSNVKPFCRDFVWSDPLIDKPFKDDTFPIYSVVICVVLVAVLFVVVEGITRWHRPAGKMSAWMHMNGWVLAQLYSVVLAFCIVNITKVCFGRLRPYFLAQLAKEGITESNYLQLSRSELCAAGRKARVSFPSGHAGTAFSGLTTLSLYLLGVFRVFIGDRFWLLTIAVLPMILPIAIAVTRTTDNHHHFSDVLAGAVIGTACALLSVLLSFQVNRAGEWTLRSHPVESNAHRRRSGDECDDEETRLQTEMHSPQVPNVFCDDANAASYPSMSTPVPMKDAGVSGSS